MRARNRAQFPNIAQIVDGFRRVFGPGVKLLHGVEPDGREVGSAPSYTRMTQHNATRLSEGREAAPEPSSTRSNGNKIFCGQSGRPATSTKEEVR